MSADLVAVAERRSAAALDRARTAAGAGDFDVVRAVELEQALAELTRYDSIAERMRDPKSRRVSGPYGRPDERTFVHGRARRHELRTNEDRILALRPDDHYLYESPVYVEVAEGQSSTATINITAYSFVGFTAGRYPGGIGILTGTGLNAVAS